MKKGFFAVSAYLLPYLFVSFIVFTACREDNDNSQIETYTIASQKPSYTDRLGLNAKYWVKKGAATEWKMFFYTIDGFDYELGYEYVVKVRATPPQEGMIGMSTTYTLLEIVSATKKSSDVPSID